MASATPDYEVVSHLQSHIEFPQRPKTDLVHSTAVRKPLVAIILNILKCMFFTRKLNN